MRSPVEVSPQDVQRSATETIKMTIQGYIPAFDTTKKIHFHSITENILLIAYTDGIQAWDLSDLEKITELFCFDIKVKYALLWDCSLFVLKETSVERYSLNDFERKEEKSFSQTLHELKINSFFLFVSQNNRIDILNHKLETVKSIHNFVGSFAVGPTWIAYGTLEAVPEHLKRQSIQAEQNSGTREEKIDAPNYEKIKHTMQNVASGIVDYGEKGIRRVERFISNPLGEKTVILKGVVKVVDLDNLESLFHFKAHSDEISKLEFDASGTLLFTASKRGHSFKVWQLVVDPGLRNSAVMLYKLMRGITTSIITSVSFCPKGKRVAVTTANNTLHEYNLPKYPYLKSDRLIQAQFKVLESLKLKINGKSFFLINETLLVLNDRCQLFQIENQIPILQWNLLRDPAIGTLNQFSLPEKHATKISWLESIDQTRESSFWNNPNVNLYIQNGNEEKRLTNVSTEEIQKVLESVTEASESNIAQQ